MSDASNQWTLWHLTPRGWERGDEKTDVEMKTVQPPADRLMTCRFKEWLGSMGSPGSMDRRAIEEWRSHDRAAVEAALHEYGPCPGSL